MCASFLRTVLIGCGYDLEVCDISTQLELCLWSCQRFLGRGDENVNCQINSYRENGMWVKEWSYLSQRMELSLIFYFTYWRRWVAASRCGAKWKVHVIRGVALVHLVSYLCTSWVLMNNDSWVLMNNDCWPWCRSGENVKTTSHSESFQLSNWVWFYDMMIEAVAGRNVFWYSFIGNLNPGRHDAYEAQTISKTKMISSMCFIHGVGTHQNALPLENA